MIRDETYSGLLSILGRLSAVGAFPTSGAEDVPELTPPVAQEGVLNSLRCRQIRRGKVSAILPICGIHTVHVSAARARLLLKAQRDLAVDHGFGNLVEVVPDEVVIDVSVELVARGHYVARKLPLAHHRGAIGVAPRVCVHTVHADRHLGVLHGDGDGGTRPTGWIGRRRRRRPTAGNGSGGDGSSRGEMCLLPVGTSVRKVAD